MPAIDQKKTASFIDKLKKVLSSFETGEEITNLRFTEVEIAEYGDVIETTKNALAAQKNVCSQLSEISTGNYNANINPRSDKDILGIALQRMTEVLRNVALAAEKLAEGDTSVRVKEQGSNDLLAQSVNKMMVTINEAADQADVISSGNYNANITPRSAKDKLGIALQRMTEVLRNVSLAAEKLADGDTSVRVREQGSNDLLAQSVNKMMITINEAADQADIISSGNYNTDISPRSDKDKLGIALQRMTKILRSTTEESDNRIWVAEGISGLNEAIRGETHTKKMASTICSYLAKYLNAQVLTFYIVDERHLSLAGSYAFNKRKTLGDTIEFGEGLVGQAALEGEMISITDVPQDYTRITSSIGNTYPRNIVVAPFVADGIVYGVIELGVFAELTDLQLSLLTALKEPLAIIIRSIAEQAKTQELLEETQSQAEELQAQQEELRASNESLEEQTLSLKASEETLQAQSEELRASNEELAEKSTYLEQQKQSIEQSRKGLEEKSQDLALASKYKSEFLANMSHELRTPLNSFLLLSQSLANNRKGNLDDEQIQDLKIINEGGHDLLHLINDIMDLSKVEAGKLNVHNEDVGISQTCANIKKLFKPSADDKKLEFIADSESNVPASINTDAQRLEQILKNFLSNAFKFTTAGSVTLNVHLPHDNVIFNNPLLVSGNVIAYSVIDTGMGIAQNKQKEIFEAFQQEDGSTSRNYGGTGLGLAISRELAKLLGGEITLQSTQGLGSTFTLYLPFTYAKQDAHEEAGVNSTVQTSESKKIMSTSDDTAFIKQPFVPHEAGQHESISANVFLIIEDDITFASQLLKLVREHGQTGVLAGTGADGVRLAIEHRPKGILLDMGLPDMDGEAVLQQLKTHEETKDIPVHVISGGEDEARALEQGAFGFLQKPITKEQVDDVLNAISHIQTTKIQKTLIVDEDKESQELIRELMQSNHIHCDAVSNGEEAIAKLLAENYDCIVTEIDIGDMKATALFDQINKAPSINKPAIIIHTKQKLTKSERHQLQEYSAIVLPKGDKYVGGLLNSALIFLHSLSSSSPQHQLMSIYGANDMKMLMNRKILIVDDDARNTFALSRSLQDTGLIVEIAENGQVALDKLYQQHDIELVVMDIMMPVMDGYEAMRQIRKKDKYKTLPIIAFTAKAMPQEREICVKAGASDYLTKPVDFNKLLSMLKVWLFKK